jgi:tetratricopeptide (TPR) repeat protein
MVARTLMALVSLVGLPAVWAATQVPPADTLFEQVAAADRALDGGRFRAAHGLLSAMGADASQVTGAGRQVLARLRVRYAMELADWPQLARLPAEFFSPDDAALYWYARGLGAARAAWPGAAPEWVELARDAASALEAHAAADGRPSRTAVWRVSVLAAVAAAQEERAELALLVDYARDLDRRLDPRDVDPIAPPGALDHLVGDLWWQVSRYADAAGAYRRSLDAGGGSARRLLGLARALDMLGQADEARRAARQFLERWAAADADRPELAEATAIARR